MYNAKMSVQLTAAPFQELERQFSLQFLESIGQRKNPLLETALVVVPSAALRKQLLQVLYQSDCNSLYGALVLSLAGLAQQIVLDSMDQPRTLLDDPIYCALMLQSISKNHPYKTSLALLSTIRDLVDGRLTPGHFQDFLEHARQDSEIQNQIGDSNNLIDLQKIYQKFLHQLNQQNFLYLPFIFSKAIDYAASWLQKKNTTLLIIYGFYDATPAQIELMETMIRQVHSVGGQTAFFFPFTVDQNFLVSHPAQFSQTFFDHIYSLTVALGGTLQTVESSQQGASAGLEQHLFRSVNPPALQPTLQVTSCGSPYDEAWITAKTILHLVLKEGVRFDQIAVMCRSLESCKTAIEHVFADNQIPHTIPQEIPLSTRPAGHFLYSLLLCKQSRLNHSLIFELLCSPLLKEPFFPAGIIRELLEILFITNSDDWERLKPLVNKNKKLPELFEIEEDDPRTDRYRRAADYLLKLREKLERIPKRATIGQFAEAISTLLEDLVHPARFREAGGEELKSLLLRLKDLPSTGSLTLKEWGEIIGDYLQTSTVEKEIQESPSVCVTVGDVMSLRGVSFDYVFLLNLNQDVFPVRITEDPFLPDSVRHCIRSVTGVGPQPKHSYPLPLAKTAKQARDEELLLFSLALCSAKKKIYLSYQRSDSEGRKKSPSIFLEEVLRLLTGKTSEDNSFVHHLPRDHAYRLKEDILPTPWECATLTECYDPEEVVTTLYPLTKDYVQQVISFGEKLNAAEREEALALDGVIEQPCDFWQEISRPQLRLSYSKMKSYVDCGFKFFAEHLLHLKISPLEPTEVTHDLTPLIKGRMAESVVKEAIVKLVRQSSDIHRAVDEATLKLRNKYSPYLPKVLLDYWLDQFSRAARKLLQFLQKEGYDFTFAQIPDRDYRPEIKLVEKENVVLNISGIPDLLFYGRRKLIGEMKWGAPATTETANSMFNRGEFQFCFYPELERQNRQLLEPADFRYFRLNAFAEIGSPHDLERKLQKLHSPNFETLMRIFGLAPKRDEVERYFQRLKEIGHQILDGQFRIIENPDDSFRPCSYCNFSLLCRRTHSATLLRAKKETTKDE